MWLFNFEGLGFRVSGLGLRLRQSHYTRIEAIVAGTSIRFRSGGSCFKGATRLESHPSNTHHPHPLPQVYKGTLLRV